MTGITLGLVGSGIILLSSALLLALAAWPWKSPPSFREIHGFSRLRSAISRNLEDGTRLHVSLGRGALISPQSTSALAGLPLLRRLTELTSSGDQSPIATSGDAALAILSQNSLQNGIQASAHGVYDPADGRLTGLTPFAYAAGAIPAILDEATSTHVLIGNFAAEAALLADAAEKANAVTIAASDNLVAQAIMYAGAHEPIIGEELFAAGAYFDAGRMHAASLRVQDILRWLLIIGMLVGALLTLAGFL